MLHSLFFIINIMTIKVKNITNRVFNWIQPGETINVEEKLKATYIHAGFKLIDEAQKETEVEETTEKTKAELVEEAKELGLEFPGNISKVKLQALIDEAQKEGGEEEK